MKKALLAIAATLPIMANATIMEITGPSPIVVNGPPPPAPTPDTVYYSPSPADRIWWSDDATTDFNPQNDANIQAVIEGLSGDTLTHVSSTTGTGTDWTYTAGLEFNYMAVHFDNQELVFFYETAQTEFSVVGLEHEFSNARAYTGLTPTCTDCNPDPVSVSAPGSVALLSLGLIGLVTARRKLK